MTIVTRQDVVDRARTKVGFHEGPNNDVPFGAAIGAPNHIPWCACFYSWAFATAGHPLPNNIQPGAERTGFLAVGAGMEYAKEKGMWLDGKDGFEQGHEADALMIDWVGNRNWNDMHVVMLSKPPATGVRKVIGGNDGDAVREYDFTYSPVVMGVAAFGRLLNQYTGTVQTGPAWPGYYFTLTTPYMHDNNIKAWQDELNKKHGYKLTVDGQYGPQSLAACRDFQHKIGITADGVVGPQTWIHTFNV